MKYVLITGAYGGMGYATVKECLKKGYTVFALDKKVSEAENNVIPIVIDISNAERFRKIVNNVEAKNISPQKIAKLALKILDKKRPKFAYNLNRNKLLLLLNAMPKCIQFFVIKKILKK